MVDQTVVAIVITRRPACVNPAHLREVNRKQNMENRRGPQSNNTSGFRGVSIHKASGRWRATIRHNGKTTHHGCFDSPEEANKVVLAKRLELYTHNEVDRRRAS